MYSRKAILSGIIGCAGVLIGIESLQESPVNLLNDSSVIRSYSLPARKERVVQGQPHLDSSLPSKWGTLITSPKESENRVQWNQLTNKHQTKPYRNADFKSEFLTIIVGVVPAGHMLSGQTQPRIEEGTIVYDYAVTNTQQLSSEGLADFHYRIDKWQLNGNKTPEDIIVV